MTRLDRVRRAMAEFIGTAFLLMAIVGSGIAAQRLSPHDVGLELLENSTATATALVAIILALGPISGAHLNPMVSLVNRVLGGMSTAEMLIYWIAQLAGAALGTILSNLMFSLPIIEISTRVRPSTGLWLAFAVGAYIAGAYWFTASTSFANPAVTLARTLTESFAGIAPTSVLPFIVAEVLGTLMAVATVRLLFASTVISH